MQNLASAFPNFAFPQSQQQQPSSTEKSDHQQPQIPPELQFLLSASLDQGLYANQLAALKNASANPPTTSTASAPSGIPGIPADFASLLLSSFSQQPQQQQQQQQQAPTEIQQQQQPQIPVTPTTTNSSSSALQQQQQQQHDDFAQLMALIAGPQAQQNAAANNFLEQMNFFASPSFNIASSQSQNSSNASSMIPTTPTSSGSGSHFFGGINASLNSPNKDKDSYCEFCDKTFCNRYFLRIHKQKKHKVMTENPASISDTPPSKQMKLEQSVSPMKQMNVSVADEELQHQQPPPKQKESAEVTPANIEAMLAAFQEAQNSKAAAAAAAAASQPDLLSLIQQLTKVKSPEPQQQQQHQEKYNCDKCSQDFTSQTLLLQHQITQHTVIPTSSPPTSTSSQQNLLNMIPAGFSSLPFMMPQLSASFPSLELENAFGNHPSINTLNQSLSKSSSQKRQYSSTTKNYCDLCNKDVCNKYFLRTHMLKMHNIVIDENKTVIANIDTQEKEKEGSVSFRCDICHLDHKTRTQLRDHKKNDHGIQPVMVTPSSASSQISQSESKPHSAMGSGASQSGISAFEFPPTSPSSSPMPEFKCTRCETDFDSFQNFIGHLHAEHSNEVSEQEIYDLIAKASTSAVASSFHQEHPHQLQEMETNEQKAIKSEDDENDDEAMEITRKVAMKMIAENQMKTNDEEMEVESDAIAAAAAGAQLSCGTCGRVYSSQQNLNDHIATVHQYKLRYSPKKETKLILSPSKVNKIIKCFICAKCNQRFTSSNSCKFHIIQHLKREQKDAELKEESGGGESSTTDEHKENKETSEDFEDTFVSSFMREEMAAASSREKSGTMIEHVVSELSRRGSHGGLAKLPEEKHSHTSGSASPMSVHTLPEGYAQPLLPAVSSSEASSPKPFILQSFIMKEISDSNSFPSELHAYLPVRNLLDGHPIRVTFELQAAPQYDAQIKNL